MEPRSDNNDNFWKIKKNTMLFHISCVVLHHFPIWTSFKFRSVKVLCYWHWAVTLLNVKLLSVSMKSDGYPASILPRDWWWFSSSHGPLPQQLAWTDPHGPALLAFPRVPGQFVPAKTRCHDCLYNFSSSLLFNKLGLEVLSSFMHNVAAGLMIHRVRCSSSEIRPMRRPALCLACSYMSVVKSPLNDSSAREDLRDPGAEVLRSAPWHFVLFLHFLFRWQK